MPTPRSTLVLNILDGCEFNCAGCYNTKLNTFDSTQFDNIKTILTSLCDSDIPCNTIVLGPTDILSANNFDSIVDHSSFADIIAKKKVMVKTTLLSPSSTIQQRWNKLQTLIGNRKINVSISLDINQLTTTPEAYVAELKSKIALLNNSNISFYANYHDGMFRNTQLSQLSSLLDSEFPNISLAITTSFLSTNLQSIAEQRLRAFNVMWIMRIHETEDPHVPPTVANGFIDQRTTTNITTLTYNNNNLYINPFIYSNISHMDDTFKIHTPHTATHITNKIDELKIAQKKYAHTTYECNECPYVSNCITKNVLSYMEVNALMECALVKEQMVAQ